MSELLVMAASQETSDPMSVPRLYQRGDPVIARDDGWPWGAQELAGPAFIIFSIPDMSTEEAASLCAEEIGDPMANPALWLRVFTIDFTKLPPDVAALIDGQTRRQEKIAASAAMITPAVGMKAPYENPYAP